MNSTEPLQKVRTDKWLWAARFFKTRALATDAIKGGKVHINGHKVKPSRLLNIGDIISVSKGYYKTVVNILALSDKRGPAKVATLLYEETKESIEQRLLITEQTKSQKLAHNDYAGKGRPSKRDRRHIIRFVNKND